MNSYEIKSWIRNLAREYHFQDVGFTVPNPEDKEILKNYFHQWIENHYHGTMEWFINSLDKRIDVQQYFPAVKSIAVFIISYAHKEEGNWKNIPFKIAKYAHGKDYHKVLRKKIRQLAGKLKEKIPDLEYKITVDSSPMAERYWAWKAGLGWIGKNSMLISRKYGSYTFLATLMTNLYIEPDVPYAKDYCGSCSACMQSCPTGAILPGKIVDSNKCISYLTIEHRGAIDESLFQRMNGWIFGCDICQEVCPWNSRKILTEEIRFHDQFDPQKLHKAILEEDQSAFDAILAGTAVRRSNAERMKRILENANPSKK